MAITFSDSTPVAPTGGTNIKWQVDGSGNVSGYTGFGSITKITVGSTAGVLTLDCSLANSFLINVTENITSTTLTNPTDGQEITLLWQEDMAGGWTISLAANMIGATAPSTGANTHSLQKFTYNIGDANWYAISAGITGL